MAVLTWPKLIAAARKGDYELLCLTLEELEGHNLTQAHCRDLAALIRDLAAGTLKRSSNRPKRSAETQALLDQQEFGRIRVVRDRLIAEAKRRGHGHLRGAAREAALHDILKNLPASFHDITQVHLDRLAQLPRARRR